MYAWDIGEGKSFPADNTVAVLSAGDGIPCSVWYNLDGRVRTGIAAMWSITRIHRDACVHVCDSCGHLAGLFNYSSPPLTLSLQEAMLSINIMEPLCGTDPWRRVFLSAFPLCFTLIVSLPPFPHICWTCITYLVLFVRATICPTPLRHAGRLQLTLVRWRPQ
jgi:hypothetical protein